jgi:5-methylcytosine-specific restriction endonuclease McrA
MKKPAEARPNRTEKSQGMNWISQHKRLAIYLRDGLSCCYCNETTEQGAKLTLDHLVPYSQGGSNRETNLVTCCLRCNSARGNRPVAQFVAATATFLNVEYTDIMKRIKNSTRRALPLAIAKEMVALRGSCAKAIAAGI